MWRPAHWAVIGLAAVAAGCSSHREIAGDGAGAAMSRNGSKVVAAKPPLQSPAALGRRDPTVFFSGDAPEPNYVYRGGRDPRNDRAVAIDCDDVARTGGDRALATFRAAGACLQQPAAYVTTEAAAPARRLR